jgi:hypothetical protein
MSELFKTETSLSPRRKWMKEMGIQTEQMPKSWLHDWAAYTRKGLTFSGYGATEEEAIEQLVINADLKSFEAWMMQGGSKK